MAWNPREAVFKYNNTQFKNFPLSSSGVTEDTSMLSQKNRINHFFDFFQMKKYLALQKVPVLRIKVPKINCANLYCQDAGQEHVKPSS